MGAGLKVLFRFDGARWLSQHVMTFAADDLDVSLCSEQEDGVYRDLLPQSDVLWHILRPVTAEAIAVLPSAAKSSA